jgi:hypothetical protein
MSSGIESTTYAIMAHGHSLITKGINAGKPSRESDDARNEKEREEERRTVIAIYNSRGKIIEYPEDHERFQETYKELLKKFREQENISA